jgi:hypothetical protein
VEERFREALGRFVFPKDLYDWMRHVIGTEHAGSKESVVSERRRLEEEKKRLDGKIENALDENRSFPPATKISDRLVTKNA